MKKYNYPIATVIAFTVEDIMNVSNEKLDDSVSNGDGMIAGYSDFLPMT